MILVTCSYGGQLSTYMRFKYPFIVDGALAASAPIFQVSGIVPGELFWNGVTVVRGKLVLSCQLVYLFLHRIITCLILCVPKE